MIYKYWIQIPDFPNYLVSNHGDVASFKTGKMKLLSPRKTRKGYLCVLLYGKPKKTIFVHRLVANFLSTTGSQINHKNGIKTDNRVENIEWVSQSENMRHAYNIGLKVAIHGDNHGRAKLTIDKAQQIRQLYSAGKNTYKSLAVMFGVSKSNIEFIIKNKTWVS